MRENEQGSCLFFRVLTLPFLVFARQCWLLSTSRLGEVLDCLGSDRYLHSGFRISRRRVPRG